jgi:hypothetical protein
VSAGIDDAESLLREIATELVSLPLDERSRPLHLKILALKRAASEWSANTPSVASVDSMLSDLRVLRAQVLDVRGSSQVRMTSASRRASLGAIKIR